MPGQKVNNSIFIFCFIFKYNTQTKSVKLIQLKLTGICIQSIRSATEASDRIELKNVSSKNLSVLNPPEIFPDLKTNDRCQTLQTLERGSTESLDQSTIMVPIVYFKYSGRESFVTNMYYNVRQLILFQLQQNPSLTISKTKISIENC